MSRCTNSYLVVLSHSAVFDYPPYAIGLFLFSVYLMKLSECEVYIVEWCGD